jgi:hypothetical protein
MNNLVSLMIALAIFLGGGLAAAQQTDKKDRRPAGIVTLAEITITGRIQKPIAAVDVARIRPTLTLSELRQPFLERIADAIYEEPF